MALKRIQDQTGREVTFTFPPQRIVSIVPSQTELLFDLGLTDQIAGITKFCIHPEHQCRVKPKVGGTKSLNISKIIALAPDLILANKEENTSGHVNDLMQHFPVWVSDVRNLNEACDMINAVGEITGKNVQAQQMTAKIFEQFGIKTPIPGILKKPTAAYIIWRNPYMTVGTDTFIHSMMQLAGFENVVTDQVRYPVITIEELKKIKPDYVLLSSEPFPFREKHLHELGDLLSNSKIILVDGEMFSWYGSRLLVSAGYFRQLMQQLRAC